MQQQKSLPQQQFFNHIPFVLPPRYQGQKLLGAGSYGQVLQALDVKLNQKVAIKKLHPVEDIVDAKRVLREIRILRSVQHDNIVKLTNVVYDTQNDTDELGTIYLVQDYYPADLYRVVRNQKDLTDDHVQYIIQIRYQLLKGLYYMHSASIMHRDIKPSNILASEDCHVCFCDFGLARKLEDQEEVDNLNASKMTEYVVTRFYRAPEVMVSSQMYSYPLDMWALGCTYAELINGGHVLFKGKSYIQMVKMIFETLGKPSEEEIQEFITNSNAREYVDSLPKKEKCSMKTYIKYSNPKALDLLDRMLEINPYKRITAKEVGNYFNILFQALAHPYFQDIREEIEEVTYKGNTSYDFEHDEKLTLDDVKKLILEEINIMKKLNSDPLIDIQQELKRLKVIMELNRNKKPQKKSTKK